ncbi:hypothetical protein D5H75_13405 [Bailinhaonella thermotolerans]|uniref:Uncharacterized protein n=1 Tax=Bailinhaonella thermotolerans TaxID=1070861 RepID=A0A3A4AW04_9ACTN|nr:hypothetical protein D5H75_13405 [Bailinhaonella thermotolerans]
MAASAPGEVTGAERSPREGREDTPPLDEGTPWGRGRRISPDQPDLGGCRDIPELKRQARRAAEMELPDDS